MKIKTVFLDAGGVLVFPNWGRVSAALAKQGVRVNAATLASAEFRAKKIFDVATTFAGTTDHQRGWPYFNLALQTAGVQLGDATDAALAELNEYHAAHNLWECIPDGTFEALDRLRAMGLTLVVVSNANGTLHGSFDRNGLTPHLDYIFDSHLVGIEKPDPRFFQHVLDLTGAHAETTVHVGDIYHVDVLGARRAGLRPILFDVADLYADADCPRVRSLGALADRFRPT
jgi:putative hydrolase of the HAD superfamily